MTGAALFVAALLASPPPAAPPVEEGWFLSSDGTRIFYKKVGRGPATAVFVHGGPGSDFRGPDRTLARLADGRAIVFYDQRGSGLSEIVTDPARLAAEDHVRDLEAVRRHFRIPRMQLIGLSWGAGLAALYAQAHPTRVQRLLLVSPMAPAKALQAGDDGEAGGTCEEPCDVPPSAIRNRETVAAAAMASLGEWDFRPLLAGIGVPTLVVAGARAVPVDATRAWAEEMPAARLLLIPEAGHDVLADQPDAFLAAADRFLRGRFPAEAELLGEADAH